MSVDRATFAAGCFWGVEAAFRKTDGVLNVTVGYTGGGVKNPTYEQVCSDRTGHAEAVLVEFESSKISYEDLLDLFWAVHDPTTPNRQGPDVGRQYRSAIFYHTPDQRDKAVASKARAEKAGRWAGRRIVTEIVPAQEFYRAEEYHQRYFERRGAANCRVC